MAPKAITVKWCAGFTWHDGNQAQWSHDCYLVTNPLGIWCEPQLLAQIIQHIESSVSGWIVRNPTHPEERIIYWLLPADL